MRGKLAKPEVRHLWWVSMACFLGGGWQIRSYVQEHMWFSLAAGLFVIAAGIYGMVTYWRINHPEIPKWAEADFKDMGKPEIHQVGES